MTRTHATPPVGAASAAIGLAEVSGRRSRLKPLLRGLAIAVLVSFAANVSLAGDYESGSVVLKTGQQQAPTPPAGGGK